jgi:uncharacterized protein YndB with AHSA1/START domain
VWRWLSSPEALRRWLSPTLEIDLRVGGAYHLLGPDEETRISGTVLELVPEGRLVLSWLEEDADWIHPARLVISLTATGAGTTVKAYERGADRHQVLEQLAELARGQHDQH